jgi:hypothetical protein
VRPDSFLKLGNFFQIGAAGPLENSFDIGAAGPFVKSGIPLIKVLPIWMKLGNFFEIGGAGHFL